MADGNGSSNTVELATELTIAWLSNPNTRANVNEVPEFLKAMHSAVEALGTNASADASGPEAQHFTPAVSAWRSLASKDYIISLIDGKPYKTLRRHLSTHGLTPQEYRERYGLKADYPIVAPNYSEARRSMAQKIGLGRKPAVPAGAAVEADKPADVAARPARRAQAPAASGGEGASRRGRKARPSPPPTSESKPQAEVERPARRTLKIPAFRAE